MRFPVTRLRLAALLASSSQMISPPRDGSVNPKDDPYGFGGWGLSTRHANPWASGRADLTDKVGAAFRLADHNLRKSIRDGVFVLSQFALSEQSSPAAIDDRLNELLWRHYIVFVSARLAGAANPTGGNPTQNYVEVGVCDGLTAYFAIVGSELAADSVMTRFVLLDSWAPMRPQDFAPGDKAKVGKYSYLRREQTEANLHSWNSRITYVEGYVPQTLNDPALPDEIAWLHIDLNSSVTTAATLDVLAPRIAEGGICLFDDDGHKPYLATKEVVDSYFQTRSDGVLLALPTGQSLWIRHRDLTASRK